jgi:hypothetical protein
VLHDKTRREELIGSADVCVINPEGLDWLTGAKRTRSPSGKIHVTVDKRRFKAFGFDTVAIDELPRFKNHNSGRSKVLREVASTFSRRWGLTGSLASKGLQDLFGQCLVLDDGRTFGRYITHFRNEYFTPDPYVPFKWNLQLGAEKRIHARLAPLALRQEVTDLPELVDVVHEMELPPTAREVYDALERDMFARLDDHTITAKNAAAVTSKLRQVAAGGVYLQPDVLELMGRHVPKGGPREWLQLHDEKTDAVESLVEELAGSPLLCAYEFGHDLERLRGRFGKDVPAIGGGTPPARFRELERAWLADELPLLLGQPQSVAHGLNLQEGEGHHVAWHSLTWDYELYDQLVRRLRRPGSRARVVFNHLIMMRDTVDEAMLGSLRAKEKGQGALYEALKKYRERRRC